MDRLSRAGHKWNRVKNAMALHAQIPKPPKNPPPEPVRKPNGEPPEDPLEPPDERPPPTSSGGAPDDATAVH